VRAAATLTLVGAVPGLVGGVVFWAFDGGTRLTRALAYGLWFAAAGALFLMAVAAQRIVWRRAPFTPPEGWVFVTAAGVLIVAGIALDVAGT
jgi:hypothetical protein